MLPEFHRGWKELSRELWASSVFRCHLQIIAKRLLERCLARPAILFVPTMLLLLYSESHLSPYAAYHVILIPGTNVSLVSEGWKSHGGIVSLRAV